MQRHTHKYLSKLDRNNTNFTLQLFEHFKKTEWSDQYSFLKYYQNIVRSFVNDVDIDSRGILVQQTMGLGKSILAISIAMDLMKERQPIILLTKSLQENMKGAIKKYINLRKKSEPDYAIGRMSDLEIEDYINHNFSFVSMNASNMLKQMGRAAEGNVAEEFDTALEKKFGEILKFASLDGKLLIVDEAHNLFRAITNGSKNAVGLYDLVMKAKNLKIAFFTGTPIANDPFELVPCFNMLGSKYSRITLPENYSDFNKLFVDDKNGKIKNKEKFQNRILGLVSYVDHLSVPGKAFGVNDPSAKAEFPEEKPIVVERVNMDAEQYVIYGLARDKEKDEGSGSKGMGSNNRPMETANVTKPKSKAASTYRVKSRQLCNFCAPAGKLEEKDPAKIPDQNLGSAKYRKVYENIAKHKNQIGILYSQFVGVGGLGTFSRFLDINGWKCINIANKPNLTDDVEDYAIYGSFVASAQTYIDQIESELISEKVWQDGDDFSLKIGSNDSPQIEHDDIDIFAELGIFGGDQEKQKYYAIISGNVSVEDRTKIQEMFNKDDNKYGGQIDLILLSSTGAEGLDLKNVRHVHVLEPYWNWSRVKQIIARGVRNDSHKALPNDEKNVSSYIYLAIPPESERQHDGLMPETTDTELYNESIKNQVVIDSFHDALKEVSIECLVNGEEFCRVCNPINQQLYTDDVARDVKSIDPCSKMQETVIKAEEIIMDGIKYYYTPDANSIYDYKIFVYDENINGYRTLKESDPKYYVIVNEIKKEKDT